MYNKKLFQKKLEHSIDLLQKAEKLALMYDKQDGFYLAFSGGKDSQALYHVAKMAGVKFKGHMSLTSVDPPQVIRFVKRNYPDVELHKPEMSMYDKAVEMGILPTMRVRWCCAEFKESAGAGKVTLIGVRAAESARRAKRHEVEVSSRKFSGDLEGFEAWSKAEIEKKTAKMKRKMNEDEFSVNSDNEVRCINGKDSILVSPIFQWTDKDVWYFLNEIVQVPHCELYDMGYTRIGCILCPMASKKSKLRDMKMFPHVKRGWIKAIKAIREGGGGILHRHDLDNTPRTATERRFGTRGTEPSSSEERRECRIPRTIRELWGNRVLRDEQSTICYHREDNRKFFDSPSQQVDWGGQNEPSEDEIAEAIFDWWISGKSYRQWFSDKYCQQKLFNETLTDDNDYM